MNVVWSFAMGLIALAAGAAIAGGEPAVAELRLAEAATRAAVVGIAAVCLIEAEAVSSERMAAPID